MRLRARGKFVVTVATVFGLVALALLSIIMMAYHRNHRTLDRSSGKSFVSKNEYLPDEQDRALDELLEAAKRKDDLVLGIPDPDYPDETRPDLEAALRENLRIVDAILPLLEDQFSMDRQTLATNILEVFVYSLIDLRPYLESGDMKGLRGGLRQVYKDRTIPNTYARASAVEALRMISRSDRLSTQVKTYRAVSKRMLTRIGEIEGRLDISSPKA
jgi:hypothetical protein